MCKMLDKIDEPMWNYNNWEGAFSGDSVEWSSALDEVCEMPEALHKTRDNQVGAR